MPLSQWLLAGGTPKACCEKGYGYRLLFLGWIEQMAKLLLGDQTGQSGFIQGQEAGLRDAGFSQAGFQPVP